MTETEQPFGHSWVDKGAYCICSLCGHSDQGLSAQQQCEDERSAYRKPECGNCRFFDLASCTDDYGDCRRYPPTILATKLMDLTEIPETGCRAMIHRLLAWLGLVTPQWPAATETPKVLDIIESTYSPLVSSCDWCGEFQQKDLV